MKFFHVSFSLEIDIECSSFYIGKFMEKYWAKIISTEATGKYADATGISDVSTGIGIFDR